MRNVACINFSGWHRQGGNIAHKVVAGIGTV